MQSAPSSTPPPAILTQAKWIWAYKPNWDQINAYAVFRKDFTLTSVPIKAPLFITADQSYQLTINGEYVCRGPARGFQHSWPYDEVDVSRWLKKGKNLIAVRGHNPSFSNFQYLTQGYAGLLVAAQWGKTKILSDDTWQARRQESIRKDMVQSSLQLFQQEVIDLRAESPEWMLPGYDASTWQNACVINVWNGEPWSDLEPRGTAMLEENEIRPGRVIGRAEGKNAEDYFTTRNLSITRFEEGLAHEPFEGDIAAIPFSKTPANGWRSVLIDLGKLHIGSVILDIKGAKGGEIVETHHYETINADTLCPDFIPGAHCRMAFSQRLTCRPGDQRHAFYHAFGYRYMILTVRDSAGAITVSPSLCTTFYPLKHNGSFTSSDTALNAIWETCAWTQRVCSMDAYVDTPWREQAQWWGDARVQAWNTFHLDGDDRLFRRGIKQIATQKAASGITYGHAPTMAHNCVLPDFTLIWIVTLWDHYWQTGSLEAFEAHQDTIQSSLAYFREWTDAKTGLLHYDPRYWLFLDWTGLRKTGCSSVYNLWLLHALDRLAQMYALSGDKKQAATCRQWAKTQRTNLLKLIDKRSGLMRDGYDEKGRIDPSTSVHAQTLAIITELCPKNKKVMLEKRIVPYLRGEYTTDIHPSAYWITYLFTVLGENGYGADVLADIRKRWSPMAEHGTCWENFEPRRGDESFSHAWSAHPLFHLMQILGGIRQTAPGWEAVTCEPLFEGESAEVSIPSPRGDIISRWERKDGTISGQLKLPRGVKATLTLPGQKPLSVTGTHRYKL
ncbi:alpha-L-rhamnosidase C-terminal domain-containing protein [Ruficoccus sp. ZRK36]|uniref:alpha-L-rhamnosidase-related protein n=1 Tax=Ruficoccus sp. ZRK36 TaxID=2866311 RepID=UPI001C738FE5|nr:alpha-L-rhamnosidase C-terminal domain-containing protein [Ruficoccus sp. ZRK36]QYY35421.1 alpha-L-rhamnosidase N-terminal domain-containing protein [Ruficoccus sp. ZRK36]